MNADLTALESELADPANPLLQKEREEENVDPGELIKELVVVRGRLDKIRKGHEGRARLIGVVLEKGRQELRQERQQEGDDGDDDEESEEEGEEDEEEELKDPGVSNIRTLIDIDKRVEQLEKLVGSSNTALDEVGT